MHTLTRAPRHYVLFGTILAMAAIILAVALTAAGPTQAQDVPTPEGCGSEIVPVADGGSVALFDAYWDYRQKNLVSNPCPPHIVHEDRTEWYYDEEARKWLQREVESSNRSISNVNIGRTIFHVPMRAAHPLTTDDGDLWDVDDYGFLGEAGDTVWILPDENTNLLHIGFSAGLLDPDDWIGNVQYEFESLREPGIGPGDRGAVLVFNNADNHPETDLEVEWTTSEPDTNELQVTPGTYEHRHWAFTKPGTYVLQVQVKGFPVPDRLVPAEAEIRTVTSEAVRYTFHVGLLADLGVTVSDDDAAPDTGEEVTLTVTASNAGPDDAPHTKVQVNLPEGLTYGSSSTASGSYDADAGLWDVGALNSGASPATLAITATVDDGTRGRELTTTASIWATENIGASEVLELDPYGGNNDGMDSLTPQVRGNAAPLFRITRSVTENADGGTLLGEPVAAYDPEGDTLTYTLAGTGAELFTVDGAGQVSVAQGAIINYEDAAAYDLVLQVSDGKDLEGNADDSPDHYLGLHVTVQDVTDETLAVSLAADATAQPVNAAVHFTATVTNSPVATDQLRYRWGGHDQNGNGATTANTQGPTWGIGGSGSGASAGETWEYHVTVWYEDAQGDPTGHITSDAVPVAWE